MKKTTLCTIANLTLIAAIWIMIVGLPNLLAGHILAWWINLLLLVGGLVTAGYLVQYILSPIVNRIIMGAKRK